MRRLWLQLVRALGAVIGTMLVLAGIPIAIATPIPFLPIGLFVSLAGVILITRSSSSASKAIRAFLMRRPRLRRRVPDRILKAMGLSSELEERR